MAAERAMEKTDFRQEFTDKIVAAIESGERLPWDKPWRAGIGPRNAVSGKEYSGMNRLMLAVAMMDAGYSDPRFVTFKQAKGLGGQVDNGQHGHLVERWDRVGFWKRKDVEIFHGSMRVKVLNVEGSVAQLDNGGSPNTSGLDVVYRGKHYSWRQAQAELDTMYSKTYIVFNVGQCKDLTLDPLPELTGAIDPEKRVLEIQEAMRADGLKFVTGPAAYYEPASDTVTTPPPGAFKDLGGYQSTLLHEIGHATGAPQRLKREGITGGHRFGSQGYAREELRAEIFSAFMAMETGITRTRDEQHQAYLQSWAEVLKRDKHEIFRAAADAGKGVDYVREKEHALLLERGSQERSAEKTEEQRIQEYEAHGMTRGDAQAVVEAEDLARAEASEARPDLPRPDPIPQQRGSVFKRPHYQIEDAKQVTGRFAGIEPASGDRVTIHMTRAGVPLTVEAPKQALDGIPLGHGKGDPLVLRHDSKLGVQVDAGKARALGVAR
ncbi:MAG: zincin-like metallopeptidase domain-containing protein [Betaproteobacteria bacterium]|nr:zincin-like metallopeptidase domain-containing protein [Betaproteobacteria bacterium]